MNPTICRCCGQSLQVPCANNPNVCAECEADTVTPVSDIVTVPDGERYFTRGELAWLLKVSMRTVDALVADRAIPFVRVGRVVRFRREDVERELAETFRVTKAQEQESGVRGQGSGH